MTTIDQPKTTTIAESRGHAGGRRDQRRAAANVDQLVRPVSGVLDLTGNTAFVRAMDYLPRTDDVSVPMSTVRSGGLRSGDIVSGVAQPSPRRAGELVRIDSVNGADPELARKRPDFYALTPVYPQERLLLETEPASYTGRLIDLMMPIGKGQRALLVAPPRAGKTTVMRAIANAIASNNPECHIMVVLVDERPEEVTDMQRSVRGEVLSSTFDQSPADHIALAELAIERAKRLVELGGDVVVLLDNITRLGRAYNNAARSSGRILTGGIDAAALYPPKRFLGAARNIEDGGSLTIIATALVETGSAGDAVIFEEYKGTGNAELKLDRRIAERRVFPAIDVLQSGTRREQAMIGAAELAAMTRLRRVLTGMDPQHALDLLIEQLKKTTSNAELLMQITHTTPPTSGR
jgi:transcription termination factor Rho